PVPGPTAMIAGLIASGLPTDSFLFAGFLPQRKSARRARLEELKSARATLIFYEAPHRIRATLADALEILGDRDAALARELTKLHEQFVRGTLSTLISHFDSNAPRGEMTLVIAGNRDDNSTQADDVSIREQVERLMRDEGLSRSEAIKQAARSRGLAKRKAYQLLLDEKESNENDENAV
ncbi:MAG: SAM-dependent methyltransferase, partial [Blastocatellia bacterium]